MTKLLLLVFLPLTSCSNMDLDCIHENEECQIVSEKSKDNLLRTVMGVSTLESCLALCTADRGNLNGQKCQAVTHFGAESYPFRDACMLFSHCKKRRWCDGCTDAYSDADAGLVRVAQLGQARQSAPAASATPARSTATTLSATSPLLRMSSPAREDVPPIKGWGAR